MVRAKWKVVPYFSKKLNLNENSNADITVKKNKKKKKFKIYNSNFVVSMDLVGFIFFVYNGNKFRKIIINEDNVGFLLSSLVITRFNDGNLHNKQKKKKKKK